MIKKVKCWAKVYLLSKIIDKATKQKIKVNGEDVTTISGLYKSWVLDGSVVNGTKIWWKGIIIGV